MKTGNILCKGLFTVVVLAIAVAPAFAEGRFSHPPIGSDPHGKIEEGNPHQQFSEGEMDGHGRSSEHGRFSGQGRSSGKHGRAGSFSEKGIKKKLHLDEDQSKKMHRLFMDYRKGTILKTANLRIAQIELDESVGGGDFDMAVIENKAKQKESAATELTMVRVQALVKAKTFLSEDQFKKFIGMVAHRMSQGKHHGKRDRHGKKGPKHHSSKRKHHGSDDMRGSTHGGFGSGSFGGGDFGGSEGY